MDKSRKPMDKSRRMIESHEPTKWTAQTTCPLCGGPIKASGLAAVNLGQLVAVGAPVRVEDRHATCEQCGRTYTLEVIWSPHEA